jgi:membrane protein
LNDIWSKEKSRPVWKRHGLAILLVLAIVGPVLFLASIASSMIANLHAWFPNTAIPIGNGISFFAAILFDISFFLVMYILLPHGPSTWREILPGAVAAGLFWELAKKIFLLVVSVFVSVSNLVYGSVTAIIAILTWAYLSGLIFLFGAYLSFNYYQSKQPKQVKESTSPKRRQPSRTIESMAK